jgi:membrane protein
MREDARAFLDERALARHDELPRLHKFAHFWLMVWRSFSRNRCPVRASALAYATLLALIPMLAVVVSITSSLLKKEGEERIDQFIVKLVASVTPAEQRVQSQETGERKQETEDRNQEPASGIVNPVSSIENPSTHQSTNPPIQAATAPPLQHSSTPSSPATLSAEEEQAVKARKAMAKYIHDFIQNTRSGTLGVTGSVLLIFAAISMLGRIEDTFNDIWGVARGRNWFMRVVLYWGVISLAPMLLIGALGLASGPHLDWTRRLLTRMPVVGNLIFEFLPLVVLCIAFALFYMLIPNTKVHWRAALAGGLVGGGLWHANNLASVLYVSRVVSNSKIYGSLGLVPVFMIGVYFSWLILLFGAQVAYAYQNRASYLEEKQMEVINQRGREFIALRVMTSVGRRFLRGEPPPSVTDLGQELAAPTRLIQQLLETLCAARLIVETTGADPAYAPARPLETITCHDILLALRAGQGQELETRDEPGRNEVYGEFRRIEEAERQAAAGVTMLALASRAEQKRIDG